MSDVEEDIRWFDHLVPKAALIHTLSYCSKYKAARFTKLLRGQECCPCKHHVLNEGICDPL